MHVCPLFKKSAQNTWSQYPVHEQNLSVIHLFYVSRKQVMSRGKLIETRRFDIEDFKIESEGNVTVAAVNFNVFNSYVPAVTIIVTYVRDDGEIVADSKTFNVGIVLKNKVSCFFVVYVFRNYFFLKV